MRKQFKKVLSMVLSAAMTLSLASGVSLATEKSASAADEWTTVAYTAAELSFTFAGEGTPTFMDKAWEGFKGAGDYTLDAYAGMTTAWTGNVGYFKCEEAYTISKAKLTLTTADGPVVLELGDYTAKINPDAEADGYKVDFPNMWSLTDGAAWISADETVRLVKSASNALGLEMKKAAPVETEAPSTSGSGTETPEPEDTANPGTGGATEAPGATDAPDPVDTPFESGIFYASAGWGISGGPEDPAAAEAAGFKLYDAKVAGKGQYKIALDLRETEDGSGDGIEFLALFVVGAEAYFPNYAIRVDAMKINGESVPDEILEKAYTCCDGDGKNNTRINLYNGYCPEDDAQKRAEARSAGDLSIATPYMLEDYIDETIETMEIAYTYGTPDWVKTQDKQNLDESIIPAPGTSTPEPEKPTEEPKGTPNPNQPTQNPGGNTPAQPTKAPVAPTQAPAAGLTNGTTAKVGGATYKVTDAKAGAVEFSAPKKNATSVTIPATVKINGKSCKVTSIKAKAFSGNKKLKSVVIGKNIKTIGKQAFFKCAKLNKVTFKGTAVKKIGAKAFAKTNKKMTVTVPKKLKKKALNSYKKSLKKAGISKKAKYKKK